MTLSLVRSLINRGLAVVGLAVVGLSLSIVSSARAGVANSGIRGASRSNPIAGVQWGIYRGPSGGLYPAYQAAKGRDKTILANLALKPIVQPLGSWDSNSEIGGAVQEIIADTTAGNPNVMSEISTFALNPWEGGACDGSWNVGSDESWYRQLARGIGSARMLAIAQIDLPFALCSSSSAPEQITGYGAETLSALPHTTVYIDAGAAEWEPATRMANLLIRSGIRHARGFSLDDTQYGSTSLELQYGAQIIAALNADGVSGKHFVVDTDENGQPYLAGQVSVGSNYTPRCTTRTQTLCQRTGIPPTTQVANPRWQLSAADAHTAADDADGYVWSGAPWDVNGGGLNLSYALALGANGEY
jgi:endoglucanase